MSWVLSQEKNAQVFGYKDHFWNGLTSLHFAKITIGVIRSKSYSKGVKHVLPFNVVTKEALVRIIAENFDRSDIEILSHHSGKPTDRSLSTEDFEANLRLWINAGYEKPPTIEEMVSEYALWESKAISNVNFD
jgi:dTDP-4-dehydrorhamnose reductase